MQLIFHALRLNGGKKWTHTCASGRRFTSALPCDEKREKPPTASTFIGDFQYSWMGAALQTGWHTNTQLPPHRSPVQTSAPISEPCARPQFRLLLWRPLIGWNRAVSMENVTESRWRRLIGPGSCPSFYINKLPSHVESHVVCIVGRWSWTVTTTRSNTALNNVSSVAIT